MKDIVVDIGQIKLNAEQILRPIKPIDSQTKIDKDFWFKAQRSIHSVRLQPYYLIYFLFFELLDYKDLGPFEKVAWGFFLDYNGKVFLIEYRKLGIGVFIQCKDEEEEAGEIVNLINRAIKKITPFFDFIVEKAIEDSKLNVRNNNIELFSRYEYLKKLYKEQFTYYQENKGEYKINKVKTESGEYTERVSLSYEFRKNSNWLAISCIEAFFSWTEHLFIHIAIVGNGLCNGEELTKLIGAEWKVKFNKAIPNHDPFIKKTYDELLVVRQQLRNFVAHGAFGKDGNAFTFHSGAGAVPVLMTHNRTENRFSLTGHLNFNDEVVVKLIEDFVDYLWNSPLKQVMCYTQKYGLPSILTYAEDGTYKKAIESFESMEEFSTNLRQQIDDSLNMDW